MGKKKLIRFKENEKFKNLFQYSYRELEKHGFPVRGKWKEEYFKNQNPITLELGCGKGEYTINLARNITDRNYVGIDIKGARLWKGCKIALDESLANVAFIRTRVHLLEYFFAENEVDEIWITFPDPQPQKSRIRKRLTFPRYLALYQKLLIPGGLVHLKTDNNTLFKYTQHVLKEENHEVLSHSCDIYNDMQDEIITGIQTYYEKIYLEENKKINYLRFRLREK